MNGFNIASPIMFKAAESSGSGWAVLGSAAVAAIGVALQSQTAKTESTVTPSAPAPVLID
jgi:hypothetical protein